MTIAEQNALDFRLRMERHRRKVAAGVVEPPQRRNGQIVRRVNAPLDGSFGPHRGRRLVLTLHVEDGRLELRPERTRQTFTIMASDVLRFAIRAKAERARRDRAIARKEAKKQRELLQIKVANLV